MPNWLQRVTRMWVHIRELGYLLPRRFKHTQGYDCCRIKNTRRCSTQPIRRGNCPWRPKTHFKGRYMYVHPCANIRCVQVNHYVFVYALAIHQGGTANFTVPCRKPFKQPLQGANNSHESLTRCARETLHACI